MFFKFKYINSLLKTSMPDFQTAAGLTGASESFIKVVKNDERRTANVIMSKLPVNSFSLEFIEELTLTIKDLENKKYKGIILSSNVPNVFSAGLDLTELFKPEETRLKKFWKSLQTLWKTLYITPLITIAAVNGHAPAGGCLLVMSCDHSIMVNSKATIGLPATKLGILVPKWLRNMYINALGFHRAEHAIKLGEVFLPDAALKLNIVDELVDSPTALMLRAEEQMDQWLKIPETSLQRTKLNLRQPLVDDLISYEEKEVDEFVKIIFDPDTQKTLGNYLEALKGNKTN